MSREFCFITVIGPDQKGIIAKMATSLYEKNINIENLSQGVLEGYFVMTVLVDVKDSKYKLEEVKDDLIKIGEKMGLHVQLLHEDTF